MLAKAALEKNGGQILLELAKASHTSSDFQYQVQKMLYQIQVHPALKKSTRSAVNICIPSIPRKGPWIYLMKPGRGFA